MMEINTYPILKSQCENIIRASKHSNKQEVENLPEDIYAFDKGLIENNLKVSATSDEYLKMIGE